MRKYKRRIRNSETTKVRNNEKTMRNSERVMRNNEKAMRKNETAKQRNCETTRCETTRLRKGEKTLPGHHTEMMDSINRVGGRYNLPPFKTQATNDTLSNEISNQVFKISRMYVFKTSVVSRPNDKCY